MTWGMVAVAGATLVGGVLNANASKKAGQVQADAAGQASANTMAMYNQNRADLGGYRALGGQPTQDALLRAMGYAPTFDDQGNLSGLTKNDSSILNQSFNPGPQFAGAQPFAFNPSDLEKYPGYQFALQQGLRGVNASAAAKGLGVSAANIRGAADYAQGLASQTYGQAYGQQLGTYQTNYGNALNTYNTNFARAKDIFNTNYSAAAQNANRLSGLVTMGQNSATQTANQGAAATANAGGFLTGGAAAQAAGTIGSANALSGAIGQGLNYNMQQQYLNQQPWQQDAYGMYNNKGYNGGYFSSSNIPGSSDFVGPTQG